MLCLPIQQFCMAIKAWRMHRLCCTCRPLDKTWYSGIVKSYDRIQVSKGIYKKLISCIRWAVRWHASAPSQWQCLMSDDLFLHHCRLIRDSNIWSESLASMHHWLKRKFFKASLTSRLGPRQFAKIAYRMVVCGPQFLSVLARMSGFLSMRCHIITVPVTTR